MREAQRPARRLYGVRLLRDKLRFASLIAKGVGMMEVEERSDEQKVVSYSGGQYAAVTSLQPSAFV